MDILIGLIVTLLMWTLQVHGAAGHIPHWMNGGHKPGHSNHGLSPHNSHSSHVHNNHAPLSYGYRTGLNGHNNNVPLFSNNFWPFLHQHGVGQHGNNNHSPSLHGQGVGQHGNNNHSLPGPTIPDHLSPDKLGIINSTTDTNKTSQSVLNHYNQTYNTWWKEFTHELIGCGQQHIPSLNPLFRVIGGHRASIKAWPWMVSMFSNLINQPWCAGTLIADQWVLTAAHCFRGPFSLTKSWILYFGKNNASGFAEYPEEQIRDISSLTIHPQYDAMAETFAFNNDIALIKLNAPVEFNDYTSPLCLVRTSDSVPTNAECTITGYGKIRTDSRLSEINNGLQAATLPLIDKALCASMDGYQDMFTNNMICAGVDNGAIDTCQGDSGGPLQCKLDEKWYIVGITSWGGKSSGQCAQPGQPGVYTDVSKYNSWIYSQIFHNYNTV